MGTVAIFLQAYDNAKDWDVLNRVICAWRDDEEKTRRECGMNSVSSAYSGCVQYTRGHVNSTNVHRGRKVQESGRNRAVSAHDLFFHNHRHMTANQSYNPFKIQTDMPDDLNDFEWEDFVAEQYEKEAAEDKRHGRELLNYNNVGPWFNYFPMLEVRTEYYYRYSGTQTIPPCYGNFYPNSRRRGSNNWRIMKDPIRVSNRQIAELNRLLKDRIAPSNDPIAACKPDTAAKVDPTTGKVITARPLQSFHEVHYEVFCECRWKSNWTEDQEWCKIKNTTERYYDHPYNFYTKGF